MIVTWSVDFVSSYLSKKYPCREKFISELCELFPGNGYECYPSAVHIFGQAATGKTSIVKDLLELYCREGWAQVAFVDCIECYSMRVMLEMLTEQLIIEEEVNDGNDQVEDERGEEDEAQNTRKDHQVKDDTPVRTYRQRLSLERMEQFIDYLSRLDYYSKDNVEDEGHRRINNFLLVFDNAERLRDLDVNTLCSLLRLQEYTRLNVSVILISRLSIEKFYPRNGLSEEIISIYCSAYNRSESLEILKAQFERNIYPKLLYWIQEIPSCSSNDHQSTLIEQINMEFYENYLNIFMGVFFKACRDLRELQITAESCFHDYVKPVLNGSIEVQDITRLWRNITESFRHALTQLYVRVEKFSSNSDGKNTHAPTLPGNDAVLQSSSMDNSVRQMAQALDLPFYAKYLLIASFLASHNSAKDDRRLFVKNHGKQRKRAQNVVAKAKVAEKMSTALGPKSFNIDRLLAIFYAIIDDRVGLTCNLLAQISTLVQLRLLSFVSGENNIMEGTARLQCTVNLEFIAHIGRMVNFNVSQYLCDFQ